jgi:predicted membrane metal-binding protein
MPDGLSLFMIFQQELKIEVLLSFLVLAQSIVQQKGIIWSYFLLAALVIMLTGSDLLKSSRRSPIFTDVITLGDKQSPTSFWQRRKNCFSELEDLFQ